MADSPERRSSGWLKTFFGAVAGIISGGVFMYVSPVVDKVIKPQKPLANFSVQTSGLQITLLNRSVGGEGFWDFGDGSALEPAMESSETVTHTYAKPGQYTVKLTIHNFLGDENERTAPVVVKGEGDGAPAILSLEAVSLCPHAIAPATFRVVSKAQNVETCVWDFGADKPLEISSDSPNEQERLVTFPRPGKYTVQLAVLNGKQGERRAVPVVVDPAPANALMGVLSVADQGTRVDTGVETVPLTLSPDVRSRPFERSIPVRAGFSVTDARVDGAPPAGVRNIAVLTNADKSRVTVAGELTASRSMPGVTSNMIVVPVAIRFERAVTESRPTARTTAPLKTPGTTTLPLAGIPPQWTNARRAMVLELFDGGPKPIASLPVPCSGAPVAWRGRTYQLKAEIAGDQAIVTLQ